MRATAVVCTLTPSPSSSSSELLAEQTLAALSEHGVETSLFRAVDHNIAPGVKIDMGKGDEWPKLRESVLNSEILLIATPIWLGHLSSVGQRVLERLNADMFEKDDEGRPVMSGKVAIAAVVGNEDGAHHVSAELFQGLNDVGFSIPSNGVTYWVGEAMQGTDFQDLDETPKPTAEATQTLARNAVHLARILEQTPYPAG